MNTKESNNYLTYYSLCNFMTDFIDERWSKNSYNVRKVKMLTNQLKQELEKSVDHIFQNKEHDGVDMEGVLEQFVQASYVMQDFFVVGLSMDKLEEAKKIELNDRLNALLKEYSIDITNEG